MDITEGIISLYYKFKSEIRWCTLKVNANETHWENVRYLIENKHKMHDIARGNKKFHQEYSYVDGFHSDENGSCNEKIKEGDILFHEARLLIVRKPIPDWKKPHVPFQRQKLFNENMSEEEKIHAVIENAGSITSSKKIFSNTTTNSMENILIKKPETNYVCYYCGSTGDHFFRNCPKKIDQSFKPLFKRKMPSGMPLNCFRSATTEEEKNKAFITNTGRLVVPK